jgi:hypothetical protein
MTANELTHHLPALHGSGRFSISPSRARSRNRLTLTTTMFLLPLLSFSGVADDIAAPSQALATHSTVSTTDGGIRDDELIDFICQKINENGGKANIKDVKLMVNSCYGGGMLDDMQRAFGPGGACEGIPWVAGSASAPGQTARGHADETLAANPDANLGSMWTDALAGTSPYNKSSNTGVITNGSSSNNVLADFQAAANNDYSGPNGTTSESPQVASGNGGDQIQWNMSGAKHEAVVFGGQQTNQRHHNNISNVEAALDKTWGSSPHNIQPVDGGSKNLLLNAIEIAANRLDKDTQLVIYLDDHGGTRYDFDEAIGDALFILLEEEETFEADLSDGWFEGQWGNFLALDSPYPSIDMNITMCNNCSNWMYHWNGYELDFPSGNPLGPVSLPLPFYKIYTGMNYLKITPQGSSQVQASGGQVQVHEDVLELSNLELNSGGINELEVGQRLIPAQSAMYFDSLRSGEGIFVELLDEEKALVYFFSYTPDGSGQSWMIGVGEQVGFGIVIKELLLPTGPSFGPDFDPNDVVISPFGGLAFAFPSCANDDSTGILNISPGEVEGYDELLLDTNYIQIAEIADCGTGETSPDSGFSGSWFDPSHNGEGVIIQVLKNGTVVIQWFTYNETGEQMWLQGTGSIVDGTLTVDNLFSTAGTAYGSGFNPDDIKVLPWGTLTMEFLSCSMATLKYNSTAGFGSGTLNMTRLSSLMGIPCE